VRARPLRFVLSVVFAVVFLGPAKAETGDVETTWRLLDYIAVDYAGAVAHGEVSSPSEYAEQNEFAATVLGIVWLWRDTKDIGRIADHAQSTFWYVLPSLPMFLVLPAMLRAGVGFWSSIGASCVLTIVLYAFTAWSLARFGIGL
jgi:hypothetical protein